MKYVLIFILTFVTIDVMASACMGQFQKAQTTCKEAKAKGEAAGKMGEAVAGKDAIGEHKAAAVAGNYERINAAEGKKCSQAADACIKSCKKKEEQSQKKQCEEMKKVGDKQQGAAKEAGGEKKQADKNAKGKGAGDASALKDMMKAMEGLMKQGEEEEPSETAVVEPDKVEPDKAVTGGSAGSSRRAGAEELAVLGENGLVGEASVDDLSLESNGEGNANNAGALGGAVGAASIGGVSSGNRATSGVPDGESVGAGGGSRNVSGVTTSDAGYGGGGSAAGGYGGSDYDSGSRTQVASVINSNMKGKTPVGMEHYNRKRGDSKSNPYNGIFSSVRERYRRMNNQEGLEDAN